MAKNIVICLDGTGCQFEQDNSNVVTIFRTLERVPGRQVAYYAPGVGTLGDPSFRTWPARKINKILGLAFGRGLEKHIVEAYSYLIEHYEEGDKIFLFGFSRGAYAARVLAAFIRVCGLLEAGSPNMIPYAMRLFKEPQPRKKPELAEYWRLRTNFRKAYARPFRKSGDWQPNCDAYQPPIRFLGLFDTVKSYGWLWNPKHLGAEAENPSVATVRHALSIDERRKFFRQMHWTPPKNPAHQDCKEVWFAGDHFDVGGGHPEAESRVSKVALEWMMEEAAARKLEFVEHRFRFYALGLYQGNAGAPPVAADRYVGPESTATIHHSLKGWWRLVQLLPKRRESWEAATWRRTIKSANKRLGRGAPEPPLLHQSVVDRIRADRDYRPANLYKNPSDSNWIDGGIREFGNTPRDFTIEHTQHAILDGESAAERQLDRQQAATASVARERHESSSGTIEKAPINKPSRLRLQRGSKPGELRLEVRPGRVDSNGVDTHYWEVGRGPALVFIHGLGFDLTQWREQMRFFGAGYRVIAYDLRAHGSSRGKSRPFEFMEWVYDLRALLGALGVERPYLCGHGLGAEIALQYSITYPGDVKAVVAAGAFSARRRLINRARVWWQAMLLAGTRILRPTNPMAALAGVTESNLYSSSFRHGHRETMAGFRRRFRSNPLDAFLDASRAQLKRTENLPLLARIETPVLLLRGSEDSLASLGETLRYRHRIAKSQLHEIQDSGHMTFEERPFQCNDLVDLFLLGRLSERRSWPEDCTEPAA